MHLEILVEDQSGKTMLDILIPKIVGEIPHTFKIHPYKGIGHIPKNMKNPKETYHRTLLDNLPKLLKGYGMAFDAYPKDYPVAVILVCDLDDKCLKMFRDDLLGMLNLCSPKPSAYFCIAIEEGEAWLLGDLTAVRRAYPKAKQGVLNSYENDSICGTWERFADAVCIGGSSTLSKKGWQAVGTEKSKWAEDVSPHMDINHNNSPSFCYFRDKLIGLARFPNENPHPRRNGG